MCLKNYARNTSPKEYVTKGLRRQDLAPDPMNQFDLWFREAIERCPVGWVETNAMTLSTAIDGEITSRTVLLKEYENHHFVFFTNYGSEKATQRDQNPAAALLVYWPWLDRQVRINGSVEKTSREKSEAYFHSRSRGSQLGAYVSTQSRELASREVLARQVRQLEEQLGKQQVPLPESWGGIALRPHRFEFWQGRLNRLHDRFR